MRQLTQLSPEELMNAAKELAVPVDLAKRVAAGGKLPVPNFAAGGIATPADAALCMALGAEAVFVGSGIFLSENPKRYAQAIVDATTYWEDAGKVAAVSESLGTPMRGIVATELPVEEQYAKRGV